MRFKCLLVCVLCFFICGCNKEAKSDKVESSDVGETIATVGYETTDKVVTDSGDIFFDSGDTIPIVKDNKVAGTLKLNRITKLGIWDWYNQTAVTNGIKYSYAINFTIDFSESIKSADDNVKLISNAYLIDSSGNVVGKPCDVGWSGFEKVAQLYDSSPVMTVEIAVQPEQNITENTELELCIKTSDGKEFDPIILDGSELNNAVVGPSVKTVDADISSINGAIYTIRIDNVHFSVNPTTFGSNKDDLKQYYDFGYAVWYKQAPNNDREVLSFDSNDGNSLQTKIVIGVQSDVDDTILYEQDTHALWFKYRDSSETMSYVTTGDATVKPGIEAQYLTNRTVPITTTVQPTYLRFRIEFPEEQRARNLQERLDFDGRYLVFQLPIGTRTLPSVYDENGVE